MAPEIVVTIDNRYEILGELGRGGMGVVYKANDLKMDRLVAIKVMTSHAHGREEYQQRFLREAKSIAKMQHPNIVVLYDYGYHGGSPYMAMEYVEGIALDKVIASRMKLTPLVKVDYIQQVCQALHYAHQCGIVHRDVKPGNIMVLEGGKRVKLLDFGIARAVGASSLSKSGMAMGTICYMSPEQTKGQRDLDGRADIFSAGVVLYELLAGTPPWGGNGDYEIMTAIIHDPYPSLSVHLANYPARLDHILERALAKDVNERYQTAEKMALDLAELEVPLKEQALEDALTQFEHGDLLRANDLVTQILRVDTRYAGAIDLRGKLQQVATLQQRSEQVRQLRTTAEEAVGQKRYHEALAAVEQAIAIDSANSELFHYRDLIRHEVKRRDDVRKKLELARRAQEMNDLSTAQELVDKALEADPTDTHARMMKSSLAQEKKQQQQQEIAEEASRALAARAFSRAKELLQQLEAIDSGFTPLALLKNALMEGEAEERRRTEIETLVRDIRRVMEGGNIAQILSVTEQALAQFPGEPPLVRLRAQAESLRDKAENERTIQEQLAAIKKLAESGNNVEALAAAENAVQRLGTDYRLQTEVAQLRQLVERERRMRAEQGVLAKARAAMDAADYEAAVKLLSSGLLDFPSSQAVADALRAAQAAAESKAQDELLQNARKRELAETLERALANEPDPETQVTLAREAAQRIPGNEAAERVLLRVQERQRQIASAIQRARKFEQELNYPQAIQEWDRVGKLYPQHPELAAQVARLSAALKPKSSALKTKPSAAAPVETQSPSTDLSATSMIAVPARSKPSPGVEERSEPVAKPEVLRSAPVTKPSPPNRRPKGLLFAIVGGVVIAITTYLLYTTRSKPPIEGGRPAAAHPQQAETVAPKPAAPAPNVGTLSIETNLDQVDIVVDGVLKGVTEKGKATINLVPGPHKVVGRKQGYTAAPQQVEIAKGGDVKLQFTLSPAEESKQPAAETTYLMITGIPGARIRVDGKTSFDVPADGSYSFPTEPGRHRVEATLDGFEHWSTVVTVRPGARIPIPIKLKVISNPPSIIAFSATPGSIQPGQSVQLHWDTQNATDVTLDQGIGNVHPKDAITVSPHATTTYKLTAKGNGPVQTKHVTVTVTELLKPVITSFEAGPDRIRAGEHGLLVWSTQNATEVTISPEPGRVDLSGHYTVAPAETTTYKLSAKSPGGTELRSKTIVVDPAPKAGSAPPSAPAQSVVDPETKAVKETIEVRYREALQSQAISEVKKVYPGLSKKDEKTLKDTFNEIKAMRVDLVCDTPTVRADSAECTCKQTTTYTTAGKVQPPHATQVTFRLKKTAGTWVILTTTAK